MKLPRDVSGTALSKILKKQFQYRDAEVIALAVATAYSYLMAKTGKLLEKARRNPGGLSFDEFKTLLARSDWMLDHQTGSHEIWYSSGRRLSIQPAGNGKAKAYQVKQFMKLLEEEESDEGPV